MNSYHTLLTLELSNYLNSGAATTEMIEHAEEQLKLVFPPSYRAFLELFGACLGDGFSIYGLSNQFTDSDTPPMWQDVVSETLRLPSGSLPTNSIAISHDGCDTGYFLECSQSDDNFEGQIIEWSPRHDGGYKTERRFLDFIKFLANR